MHSPQKIIHVKKIIPLILTICLSITHIEVSNAETEYTLLTNIDETLNNAFETLLKAEENGAHIDELIIEFNTANSLYQDLRTALIDGDTDKATITALECERISLQVTEEANSLATAALEQKGIQRERRNLILPSAIIIVIIFSLVLWKRFKQYYVRQALGMKPTVIDDEFE
jgi:hypothetical protein